MGRQGAAWSRLLKRDLDPGTILVEVDDTDGYERRTTLSILLTQALHHRTDHRSQVSTALTAMGLQPPAIDVWTFGLDAGSVTEVTPTS